MSSYISASQLDELFVRLDWDSIFKGTRLSTSFFESFSCKSLVKALLLPYIWPITSDRKLVTNLRSSEGLQILCGFHKPIKPENDFDDSYSFSATAPKKPLPSRSTFQHFRQHLLFGNELATVLIRALIAIFLSENRALHFANFTHDSTFAEHPNSIFDLSANEKSYSVDYQQEEKQIRLLPSNNKDNLFDEKILLSNINYENNTPQMALFFLEEKIFSRRLGLPVIGRAVDKGGEVINFKIFNPFWVGIPSRETDQTPYHVDSLSRYLACNMLVVHPKTKKILLGLRKKGYGQDSYGLPAGRMENKDVSISECARRELKEETNLNVKLKDILPISQKINLRFGRAPVMSIGVLITKFSGHLKVLEPSETDQWKWFDINTLPEPIFEPAREVIQTYLNNPVSKLEWVILENQRMEFLNPEQMALDFLKTKGTY